MEHDDSIIPLGYAMICTNCNRRVELPAADTEEQAYEDARKKGWVFADGKHFCHDGCAKELLAGICQHIWPRSGPNAFVCTKCGFKRLGAPMTHHPHGAKR